MESIAEETLRDILFRLPTRDVARGRCVSWQWRRILTNPSFVYLHSHAAHVVSTPGSTPAEALAVLEIRVRGIGLDMVVLNPTTAKVMGRITDLAPAYSPVNACNGYLLLAALGGKYKDWPVFVSNPVTGGTLKIPPPPNIDLLVKYAMGFSPSSHQYKLFCLSYRWGAESPQSYLDVLTLGVGGGNRWRRHRRTFPNHAVPDFFLPLTVLIDGKLYVLMERQGHYRTPDRMLVIDVATEARRTLRLPVDSGVLLPTAHVQPFELCGELCIAVRVAGQQKLTFWVVPPKDHRDDGERLHGWELRYTFHVNDDSNDPPSGAWFDDGDGMLCYRLGDILHQYKIKANGNRAIAGGFSEWDHRIQLPATLAQSEFDWKKTEENRWNVYSGYRPSFSHPELPLTPFCPRRC
ncbi:unnamed protein product [Triticum turgidum subsp. durum]|uniref:F-box domain-containing protein n=1 Tax=Triticum turgidum subsp. durum TaxID=4567 RepID=A0A9R1AV23_TRITD|nr:unnamed protein product [Triticum turgidum subsp. durum]